jgi:hypothetical protein
MSIFNKREKDIEITLKDGKKLKLKGEVTTTFNWAIIETQNELISINRQELIMIKEK